MRPLQAIVAAPLIALVAAGPAAAQWSQPRDVSGPGFASTRVTTAYDALGDGLLVWAAQPGPYYATATRPAGAAAWRLGPRLPSRLAYLHAQPSIALYARSRALLVGAQRGGSGPALRYRMVASFGRSEGTFGALRTLDVGAIIGRRAPRSLSSPSLAANAAGDAIAAWSRDDGRTSVIRVTERRAAGALDAVRTRSPQDARVPAASINARRDRVVAWYRHGRIEARVRRPGGRWGSVLTVARSRHTPSVLRAAIDRRGRILLAWATIDYREGRPSRLTFDAAVRPRGHGWTHHVLQHYAAHGFPFSGAQQRLWALFDSSGRGFVAWHGREGDRPAVLVAQLDASSRFTEPDVITDPDEPARPTDLTAGPGQRVAIVWERETGQVVLRSQVRAAIRLPGAGFGPAESLPVACPAGASICMPGDARAAFDPATGELTAAWLQRDDGNYRVWASTRAAP